MRMCTQRKALNAKHCTRRPQAPSQTWQADRLNIRLNTPQGCLRNFSVLTDFSRNCLNLALSSFDSHSASSRSREHSSRAPSVMASSRQKVLPLGNLRGSVSAITVTIIASKSLSGDSSRMGEIAQLDRHMLAIAISQSWIGLNGIA